MATFAYNDQQKRAINLDNVDSITKDSADGFEIHFEQALFNGSSAGLAVIDRWRFSTEKDRDRAYRSIVQHYGLPHG